MQNPTAIVIGGTGAGKALHLARLGLATRLLTVPEDGPADRSSLDVAGVQVVAPTSPVEAECSLLADLVFVDVGRHTRPVLPLLHGSGVRPWVDLHEWDGRSSELHDPFIEAAGYVVLSDMELDNPLRTAEKLLPSKEVVVLTHGRRGATAFFPDTEPFFVSPQDVGTVVDTDGADDAFYAGTAYGRVLGWDWPRALHHGAVVAWSKAQRLGG